jgi:hypothetical protein
MVIHSLWITDTGRCVVAYWRVSRVPGLVTVPDLEVECTVGSRCRGRPHLFV